METMKTTIWKQGKPKWKRQKRWTYSTSFVLNHNLDEIRQGKLFLMYRINRSTAVLPSSYLVRSSLIQQEFKVVDPCLITFNSKTGGMNRNFWIGNAIWQATCGLSAFDLTFRWKLCKEVKSPLKWRKRLEGNGWFQKENPRYPMIPSVHLLTTV